MGMVTHPSRKIGESWQGSNGGGKGWNYNNQTQTWEMPEAQSRFLDWLLSDPRIPSSLKAWAVENGYDESTPQRWKKDKRFRAEWERRAAELNISTDRVQSVVDSLHRAAVGGDTKAAMAYLQYVGRFMPTTKVVTEASDTKSLTDEELLAELQQLTKEMS